MLLPSDCKDVRTIRMDIPIELISDYNVLQDVLYRDTRES